MINLVVGSPGHGKTQFMIKQIIDMIKENDKLEERGDAPRQIFCDIKELLIPQVEPAPDDWRDTPDGSIIIYDEVHFRKAYEYKGNQYSQDAMIKDLTIHRHTNKDLWFITQDAQRIEKGIHKLIDKMFYLKRPASKPDYTNVYEFDKWMASPEPAANRNAKIKKYLDHYVFKFSDKYQRLYNSASDHSSIKFRLPKQLFYFLGIVVAIITFAIFAISNTKSFDTKRFEEKTNVPNQVDTKNDTAKINQQTFEQDNLDLECRKAINVEKPQCVDWFNDLSNQTSNNNEVKYDPNKPFDDKVQKNLMYEVSSKPVFSGCIKANGKYTAYTQQGTVLNDVKAIDCERLIEKGERPFNYFATKSRNESSTPVQFDQPVRSVSSKFGVIIGQTDPQLETSLRESRDSAWSAINIKKETPAPLNQ